MDVVTVSHSCVNVLSGCCDSIALLGGWFDGCCDSVSHFCMDGLVDFARVCHTCVIGMDVMSITLLCGCCDSV